MSETTDKENELVETLRECERGETLRVETDECDEQLTVHVDYVDDTHKQDGILEIGFDLDTDEHTVPSDKFPSDHGTIVTFYDSTGFSALSLAIRDPDADGRNEYNELGDVVNVERTATDEQPNEETTMNEETDTDDDTTQDEPYQVMPDLPEEEYEQMKKGIEENGGLREGEKIIVDTDGNIIDGHHRMRACKELGIEPEVIVVEYENDREKRMDAWKRNVQRRQINKKDAVKRFLQSDWDGETQTEIARIMNTSQYTVSKAQEEISEDEPVTADNADSADDGGNNIGTNNSPTPMNNEQKRALVRQYIDANPDESNRSVADSVACDISHHTVGDVREKMNTENSGDADSADDGGNNIGTNNSPSDDDSDDEDNTIDINIKGEVEFPDDDALTLHMTLSGNILEELQEESGGDTSEKETMLENIIMDGVEQ